MRAKVEVGLRAWKKEMAFIPGSRFRLSGKVVDVEVMGYVAHNSGNNGWSGPMSSGDWVRLRLSPVHNGPNLSDERHLREFGKRTGGFFQVMDGYDWEWNDVSCPFDGVDNNKEALLTILGPDNSAAADEILEDRDVASALQTFLAEFLK
jgi:hypothetical protein